MRPARSCRAEFNSANLMLRPSLLIALVAAPLAAQTIRSPFSTNYSYVDLGTPSGVPANLGGVAFRIGERNNLYIMGGANGATGELYRITVTRDANNHITGFSGAATLVASAANNDGGLQNGPGNVMFYTRYPLNELGQIKPTSSATDKVISLSTFSVCSSVGALSFVPAGFPNGGRLKIASYNCNRFYTFNVTPDANGTYDISLASVAQGAQISGGIEGFFYVPPDSPSFVNFRSMVVCEYGAGAVTVYDIDANGDPVASTRRIFMDGLSGAEGAAIDPVSGDFVFSTYGGGNRVLAVRGFGLPCGAVVPYGTGTAGTGGRVPQIGSGGCFARNQSVTIDIGNGLGSTFGILLAGVQQANLPILGITALVNPVFVVNHSLTAGGTFAFPLTIPDNTHLLNTDFYFQGVYADPAATQGLSASAGMRLQVR